MVDFKKFVKREKPVDLSNLLTVFESLDRQTSHIDLRTVQKEALEQLSHTRTNKDIVLKISTGSGKTAIALLFLFSHMVEKEQPVVFLCPTIQLVKQALDEATRLGIKAVHYRGGETFPHVDGTAGKAIIVCTYDKLFNAKTTFLRPDVDLKPCAIVCDDAHAGVEEIRDSFTLRIESDHSCYKLLLDILSPSCKEYDISKWNGIIHRDPQVAFEVPFWTWQSLNSEIHEILSPNSEEDGFKFVWPYLSDILKRCRCIISSSGIEIIPDVIPIRKVTPFANADHRLFMSATLADDTVLIRELGCSLEAAKEPVIPRSDKGMGERMVIAPSLVDPRLNRQWVMKLCSALSRKVNVVVLSPSEWAAREWEGDGAHVFLGDDVTAAVEQLKGKAPSFRYVAFAQRYDGVDLPDNACRILVIDGMPYGEGIADKFDSSVSSIPGGVRNRMVYRIEQGMGRAVRSHVDYAVVILSGHDIAHFIAKRDVLAAMNPDTASQLRLALDLAEMAKEDSEDSHKAIVDMITQCLQRDDGWKQFYSERMSKSRQGRKNTDATMLNMVFSERQAFEYALDKQFDKAVEVLRAALNKLLIAEDLKGWYLQKSANYMYEMNQGEAFEMQRAAREKNAQLFCPPNVTKRAIIPEQVDVQSRIISWYSQFENPNGVIARIEDLRAKLSYDVSPETIEESLKELAFLVGAEGQRPENELGEGPDDLWLWPNISLVIEVKNENKKSLHKKDSGQLHTSLEWFRHYYKSTHNVIPIVVAKMSAADRGSQFPRGTRVLTPDKIKGLLNNLNSFYSALIKEPPLLRNPRKVGELQVQYRILPEQFSGKYTVPLRAEK
jgi:hypothetical protein